LRLLPPPLEEIDDFEPLPADSDYSLSTRPQRPGELCDWLELQLSKEAAAHLEANARVPAGLWLVIAIEAQRNLELMGDVGESGLTGRLDLAAEEPIGAVVARAPARELHAYSEALRAGAAGTQELPDRRLILTPSKSMSTAWEHHARDRGLTLGSWARAEAESRPPGAISWEAAAAERGQSLAEWMLFKAGAS